MSDLVAACAVGHLQSVPAVDLTDQEEMNNSSKLIVATKNDGGEIVLCDSGESRIRGAKAMQELLELGSKGCASVRAEMRKEMRSAAAIVFAAKHSVREELELEKRNAAVVGTSASS